MFWLQKDTSGETGESPPEVGSKDLFEENFTELKKWVNVTTSKYGILSVMRERRSGRLGTALKVTT